jgi:hypothetical protein
MEKRGIIEEGITPPEIPVKKDEKVLIPELENHFTKRASDKVVEELKDK